MGAPDLRDPSGVTARLRACARLSAASDPRPSVSMSAEAVTARLIEVAEVSALCMELDRALRREDTSR